MTNNLKIKIASILIILYGLFVLINALFYYFILLPGETDIFRGILRTIGSFIVAYSVYMRYKFIYWFILIGSITLAILGMLGSLLLIKSLGFSWGLMINFVPILLLIAVFIILLPKNIREQFTQTTN